MVNVQELLTQQQNGSNSNFMGSGERDPKKDRQNFYLAILGGNIAFNFLYFIIWLIDGDKTSLPYQIFNKLTTLITPVPTLSIFILMQLFVTYIMYLDFKNGKKQYNKENITGFINNLNLIVFIVLINIAIGTYLGSENIIAELNGFGIILLILSSIYLIYSSKKILEIGKDIIDKILHREEEEPVEEEAEVEIKKYDWIQEYYKFDMASRSGNPITEDVIRAKQMFYRFTLANYFSGLINLVNQTFFIEQKKLIAKEVYEEGGEATYVIIDHPNIGSQEDMDKLLNKLDFSNEYIQINNAFIGIKIRTKYLNNPGHLQKIGDEILPDQKLEKVKERFFSPIKKLKEGSRDYNQMMSETKRPYNLFQSIGIQKIGSSWYVIFNFSKWFRKLVIFPQLDTLTTILEKNNITQFDDKPNPLMYFGEKSTGGLTGLKLGQARHILFGGQSGSGKSVFLNGIIYQLIYSTTPDVLKLVLIDPLKVSFQKLRKINNLAYPVAVTEEEANNAINFLVEMNDDRYTFLNGLGGYEDIYSYNEDINNKIIQLSDETGIPQTYRLPSNNSLKYSELKVLDENIIKKKNYKGYSIGTVIPQVMLVYDEFNALNSKPLYLKNKSLEKLIKLSEQARKAGIILCLGTQTISADSVPSALRENLPTKICLTVGSRANSRAILGENAENKSEGSTLTGYGDMLIYNNTELNATQAIRAQGFYVSDEEMNQLILENLEIFQMNDFIYQDGAVNKYSWIKDFYSTEDVIFESGKKLDSKYIERNVEKLRTTGINLSSQLPLIIRHVNQFFINQRTQVLDKINLDITKRNIEISTLSFQTEQELLEKIEMLDYSNKYYSITKSFLRLKLNTNYLSTPEKLLKLEDKLNLQLIELQKSIIFKPLKPYDKDSEDYLKMIKEYEKEYTLIQNFAIVQIKNNFYLQLNYTPAYKKTVIFPQSKTIKQQLTAKYGDRVSNLLNGIKTIF